MDAPRGHAARGAAPRGHAAPAASGTALARLAGLLADETRARFCLALLDGRAWTAGELARSAGVAAPTASGHLDRLVAGGLLEEVRQGRHRYVRLADPQLAQLIEDMAAHAGPPPAPRGLRHASASAAMTRARTCYDHLAGGLGVGVTDALLRRGLLQESTGFALTDAGLAWFRQRGMDPTPRRGSRRPVARACLDWTERRTHLAGLAGAALCAHALDEGWCERIGSRRALRVTARGRDALGALGVAPEALAAAEARTEPRTEPRGGPHTDARTASSRRGAA
ncbi:ArsR family transcriptional regulator [Streptomyces armeniacus]|uniref:ArsR family transcriptional regulator n=1 Tax=Streptomyces armeniacus TaxID=83291 RepID=A0A345XTI9_9ACTN|nr:winged helix-turn-helix domain-containing protein [Streptomyces armeniacus]AXK34955.1 ArsR family transcriptional regulator [Streptomyces armeniacus]